MPDAPATLTNEEWNSLCRAAGVEHTERACDNLKVAVERIVEARTRVIPPEVDQP